MKSLVLVFLLAGLSSYAQPHTRPFRCAINYAATPVLDPTPYAWKDTIRFVIKDTLNFEGRRIFKVFVSGNYLPKEDLVLWRRPNGVPDVWPTRFYSGAVNSRCEALRLVYDFKNREKLIAADMLRQKIARGTTW